MMFPGDSPQRATASHPIVVRRQTGSGRSAILLIGLVIVAGLLAAWLAPRIWNGTLHDIDSLLETVEQAFESSDSRSPRKTPTVCRNRFERLLAGYSVRRQEFMPFIDDFDAVENCRTQFDANNPDHWVIAAILDLQKSNPNFRQAAGLFAGACDRGSRVGCAWSAVWPKSGPYPVIEASDVLRRLAPFLDGTLPFADTTAALALLYGSSRTPESDAQAKAFLQRAANAGDKWAAQELAAFPVRRR